MRAKRIRRRRWIDARMYLLAQSKSGVVVLAVWLHIASSEKPRRRLKNMKRSSIDLLFLVFTFCWLLLLLPLLSPFNYFLSLLFFILKLISCCSKWFWLLEMRLKTKLNRSFALSKKVRQVYLTLHCSFSFQFWLFKLDF